MFTRIELFSQKNDRDSLMALLRSDKMADTTKGMIYNTIAKDFAPNFPDSVIFYAKKGAPVIKTNKKWKSNLINTIGVGYFYKSNFDSALHYYLIALKLREEDRNEKLIVSSYNNLAVIYQIKGDEKQALEYYFKTLRFRERAKDEEGIAKVCENIANLYLEQNELRKALSYQERTRKIREKNRDTVYLASLYLNIANSYDLLQMFDSVHYYLSISIPVLIKYDQINYLGQAYTTMGIYYSRRKNDQLALNYFIKSKECYAKIGDEVSVMSALVNAGIAKVNLNSFKDGLDDCKAALPLLEEVNYHEKLRYCYYCLYKALRGLKRDKEALLYHEKYVVLKDTLLNQERTKELTRIELDHEYTAKTEINELKHQKDIEVREQEKKNQQLLIYFIAFGFAVAVFLVFFIINRLKLSRKQSKIIEQQKHLVEEKQKEIIDSINYAKRIQTTLLAHADFVNENIPSNFVLFRPKDIVSGDFYWAAKKDHLFYLAACDSTGHGVPGAFMSLLNIGFLTEAINEKSILEPNQVFNYVRDRLISTISKEGQQDGFDGILLCIDQKNNKLTYSAANNAPIIISNGEIVTLETDKMPVGKGISESSFRLFNITLTANDSLYIYTDGYADQFGGPKGKKFLYKKMNQLIASLSLLPLEEQKAKLEIAFDKWKGDLEQVDDVLVIGIKI
ncbi:MAG: tetratricopeptide repeat protein [Bacteroidota bacterium]|nr:tetratricopeptide repeat protein [Bacteroidota bacterium]